MCNIIERNINCVDWAPRKISASKGDDIPQLIAKAFQIAVLARDILAPNGCVPIWPAHQHFLVYSIQSVSERNMCHFVIYETTICEPQQPLLKLRAGGIYI